ncbi:hypothetical protein JW921_00265, partial [Candidatus Fermentibacterales bacterium]|nr:hypothetical protein [Candidatus Fermentibacterales bacterium]
TGLQPEVLTGLIEEGGARPFLPVVVRSGMGVQEVSSLAENLYRMGGVILEVVPMRRYPLGCLYSHLIGYVGRAEQDYRYPGEMVGRAGLELVFNDRLRGEPGFRSQVVDAIGQVVEEFEGTGQTTPRPGGDLVLTVDSRLMGIADSLLSAGSTPGSIVVIDYSTGELLCMASWPTFDPRAFVRGMSQAEWDAIRNDSGNPLLGRSWAALYPPGSTYKIVTAAYLLERGIVSRDSRPDPCFGVYELGGNEFGCWRSHGRIGIVDALAQSCDIFFYRTIQEGDMDDLAGFSRGLGLGQRILDLPGEQEGLVPDRQLMEDMYGPGRWGLGNLLNVAIGQGELLVTPLQMAVITGIFASRGTMPGPRLILDGEPMKLPDSPVGSTETWQVVEEGMRRAVTDSRGTLHRAMDGSELEFYGKSGTAESPGGDHAWFIGYVREPRTLAVAVVLEEGGHGGAVAAPVAETLLTVYCGGGHD